MLIRVDSDVDWIVKTHNVSMEHLTGGSELQAMKDFLRLEDEGWTFNAMSPRMAAYGHIEVAELPVQSIVDGAYLPVIDRKHLPVQRYAITWVSSDRLQIGNRYHLMSEIMRRLEASAGEHSMVEAAQEKHRPHMGHICRQLVHYPWRSYTRKKLRRMRYHDIKRAWDRLCGKAWRVRVTKFAYIAVDVETKTCYYSGYLPLVIKVIKGEVPCMHS
jgi:hypothetical protein